MKDKKLSLKDLMVKSFVTKQNGQNAKTIKGGLHTYWDHCEGSEILCEETEITCMACNFP